MRSGQDYEGYWVLGSGAGFGLNPFEIRAGLRVTKQQTIAAVERLNPFEIRAGLRGEAIEALDKMLVLIPLRSGQDYESSFGGGTRHCRCLNPFEIRAGLRVTSINNKEQTMSLNPFEIRAGLRAKSSPASLYLPSLNPFEIRAGLRDDEATNHSGSRS